jgi:N-acyl-D-aspartate/D-glutamate deacylase
MAIEAPGKGHIRKYDLIIRNGYIVDGSGAPGYMGDIAVKHGTIKKIGILDCLKADHVIDAGGSVIAPGFIESHANDRPERLIANPYASSMLYQGVTSMIMGEQGFAPSLHMGETGYAQLEDGFDLLMEHGIAVNYGSYVDQGDIRIAVMGFEAGDPTTEQLQEMKTLVATAMDQGALGLSSALIYAPGSYSNTETLIELAKVAANYGGTYKTHVRGEDSFTLQEGRGIREAVDIGRAAGLPVIINHMKAPGIVCYQEQTMQQMIQYIEEVRNDGQEVSAQMYPYQYGATALHALLPPWQQEGGKEAMVARLQDPDTRAQIRQEIYQEIPTDPFFNFVMITAGGNWEKIKLVFAVAEENQVFVGKDFYEIASIMGYDIVNSPRDAIEAFFDMVISEYTDSQTTSGTGGTQPVVILPAIYAEEDMLLGLKQSWVGIASDALALTLEGPKLHPRAFGSFARVLGYFSRERGLFSLEHAVYKMTGLIAKQVKLKKRGLLRKGYAADIVVFDPAVVIDLADYGNPNVYPPGIEYVIVNGEVVLVDGETTGALPGRILRLCGKKRRVMEDEQIKE